MNNFIQTIVFTLILLLLPTQEESDHSKIQGIWRVIEVRNDGNWTSKYIPDQGWNIFADKLMLNCTGRRIIRKQYYELYPNKTPKMIALFQTNQHSPYKVGIYKFEENTLKMCLGTKDDIPKSFDAPAGSGYLFAILKKQD